MDRDRPGSEGAAEEARRTLAEWMAGRGGDWGPADASPAEADAWHQREWDRITQSVIAYPDAWYSALLESIRDSTDEIVFGRYPWFPFTSVLVAGGAQIQRRAADAARDDPRLAAVVFWALEDQTTLPGQPWTREAATVSLLGLDLTVATAVRTLTAAQAADPDDPSPWRTVDSWAFDLADRLSRRAPELAWDFVRRLVAAVPDDVLDLVGASELEDFCWQNAGAYIDQIETEAKGDPRFRIALASVWPGRETIPPLIYARIRHAAGLA